MGQATNTFAGIVGYFRYNSFIVCYPVGITGELMAYYMAWENFSRLPKDQKPFTYLMPNTYNVAFDFPCFIQYMIPLLYLAIFPQLYLHMFGQRDKYNKATALELAKAALEVPSDQKEFKSVDRLNYLDG